MKIGNTQDEMESLRPPPQPLLTPQDARLATQGDIDALLKSILVPKTIASAASLFNGACIGSDSYENNCAHFLSDAFLRAGFTDLAALAPCINARCGSSAKRPVRARDMWCWFKGKQTDFREKIPSKEGFWAVFQLNEVDYWGGHVLIIDTDKNIAYGTANYPAWEQYCYKW